MRGKLISTAADFPNVRVFEDAGPVYRLAFKNLEQRSLGNQMCWMLGAPLAMVAFFAWVVAPAMEIDGYREIAGGGGLLFGGFILPAIIWRIGLGPMRTRCVIEVDYKADRLRVFRNGRVVVSRQESRLRNTTIASHPMAEWERHKKQGKVGPFQKQHCLFGWFGAEGAEKVMLVSRWEWPPQNSLFEVRQAIRWVRKRGRDAESAGGENKRTGRAKPGGMRPPRD
jgi:hypothetical protein